MAISAILHIAVADIVSHVVDVAGLAGGDFGDVANKYAGLH